jgi:oxygen-independent coproporphyrinogen-3 oxidase
VSLFTERTGLPIGRISAALDLAEARGLLRRDHLHIQPTALGLRFHNDLVELFLDG